MAVDNLPAELPRDASAGFGDAFVKHVIPAFFNKDKDGILERALNDQKWETYQTIFLSTGLCGWQGINGIERKERGCLKSHYKLSRGWKRSQWCWLDNNG